MQCRFPLSSRMHFYKHHYSASRLSQLDLAWYVLYIMMTAVGKHVLVTKREQVLFECAIAATVAVLLLKLCSPCIYAQWRPAIVFAFHVMLTTLRALAVVSEAPAQATFWRPMRNTIPGHNHDPLIFYFCTMLGVTGGSHRLLELLGLQQPCSYHSIVTVYYLLLQFAAGLVGCRMGYANALFYMSHEGFDTMTSWVDSILESILALPTSQQATCNSCPGLSLYTTVLLYTGAALPLYVLYVLERAAYKAFTTQMAALHAAQRNQPPHQQQQQLLLPSDEQASLQEQHSWQQRVNGMQQWLRRRWQRASDHAGFEDGSWVVRQVGRQLQPMAPVQQQQLQSGQQPLLQLLQHPQQLAAFPASLHLPAEVQHVLLEDIGRGCLLNSCLRHFLILLGLLLACWCCALLGTTLAVRQMTPESAAWWCPNRPRPPFLIAGQVYHGLG